MEIKDFTSEERIYVSKILHDEFDSLLIRKHDLSAHGVNEDNYVMALYTKRLSALSRFIDWLHTA